MAARSIWKRYGCGSAVVAVLACGAASGQQAPGDSPAQLVRRAVQHEVAENNDSAAHFMFKDHRSTARLSQLKLIVETRDATAGMLLAQNGQALTSQQAQAENARLEGYVRNPEQLNRKRKQEREDAEHSARIMKAMPDAFLYEADGAQEGTSEVGCPGHQLVRFKFRPNPDYKPPTHVEQVLTGMVGHMLIDAEEDRIASIDGILQKEVEFGWGILGHLDPGGRFLVHQADVGDHHWEVTRMELSFTGKILLVKHLSIHSTDVFTDFRPVPANLSFAQGVDLLKREVAEKHSPGRNKKEVEAKSGEGKTEAESRNESGGKLCCSR